MGREIRRVPPGWQHPKDFRGHYKPLNDMPWRDAMRSWLEDYSDEWQTWTDKEDIEPPPHPEYYRSEWSEEPTAYQVYETVSEGTPVSPVFSSLADVRTWAIAQGHSERAADEFCRLGHALSVLIGPGGIKMGIDTLD
jgi:hypothetical protein